MALAVPDDIDWEQVFEDASWFHITGVTPAISASAADIALKAMRIARARGVKASFDLNYRRKLWKWGREAPHVLGEMIEHADIVIGNQEHLHLVLGIAEPVGSEEVIQRLLRKYGNVEAAAMSMRTFESTLQHTWSACTIA
jgi:2-dehydro-3-deoxygluconokinase